MDDDPFNPNPSQATELRGGGGSRRRPQAIHAPHAEVLLPGLSSDDDDDLPARMPSMADDYLSVEAMRRARAQHQGAISDYYSQIHPPTQARQEVEMEVDESTLDAVERAEIQAAMQEDTEEGLSLIHI